jgi:hypothetical protein
LQAGGRCWLRAGSIGKTNTVADGTLGAQVRFYRLTTLQLCNFEIGNRAFMQGQFGKSSFHKTIINGMVEVIYITAEAVEVIYITAEAADKACPSNRGGRYRKTNHNSRHRCR